MRKQKLKRYDEMKATSLNAEQINILIEVLALAKANVENYINTKCEIAGICAQEKLDAAIEFCMARGIIEESRDNVFNVLNKRR
jgi:hypothetical protein